jgi:microcystin-dependent protein
MANPYVGQIIAVGFNFAPVGWFLCNGQLLPISEYETLYTLIGTTYGGDGVQTFAVPNLQGRTPLSMGQGPGLSGYVEGQASGTETVTLTAAQNGSHSHLLRTSVAVGAVSTATASTALAQGSSSLVTTYGTTAANTSLGASSIGPASGGLPHENHQPYLTVNYIISAFGVFPSQG